LFWPFLRSFGSKTKVERAAMLLTACEKGLVDGVADVAPAGQASNSVLQVRTQGSWGSVLLIIFYVENLDVGSWGVKNDV